MLKSQVSFASSDEEQRDNRQFDSEPHNQDASRPDLPRIQTSASADATVPSKSGKSNIPTERTSLLPGRHMNPMQYSDSRRSSLQSKLSYDSLSPSERLRDPHATYSRWNPSGSWANHSPIFTRSGLRTPRTPRLQYSISGAFLNQERMWYDQFTSTDWVRDSIADGHRILELQKRKDFKGRVLAIFDAAQGWILVAIIGCLTAAVAYLVDIVEGSLFDWKRGYCQKSWYLNRAKCCRGEEVCSTWRSWSSVLGSKDTENTVLNWTFFTIGCLLLAGISCSLTLLTKRVIPSQIAATLDEDLGARPAESKGSEASPTNTTIQYAPAMTYYSAAGSGVAEVKVILSGFILHGYLGVKTLIIKSLALSVSVASGMSLGKEGPYVHIATCIGNVACRLFSKYNLNDAKRREVLSAAAASGVAVAFGSPLGGVLFSLEEVSYYFPPKTLFRTFFCCIVAALSLKFLNPYGTNKIVMFEVRYVSDWNIFELVCFAFVGVIGGLMGALFIKASRSWAKTFRRIPTIKAWPMLEVLLVALITGLVSYWNRYANLAVAELLLELASPCTPNSRTGLCPDTKDDIPSIIRYLAIALVIKSFLTVITFGIKVPAGIYVPSMVVGGLMGRIIGHTVQYLAIQFSDSCPATGNLESCVTPGVYALVAAGATMCGVTRLSVTLAVILFELTGSLDHVLPFSLGVLCAKWTADFIEPHSIYDLLIDMNSYPFMDNRATPVFDTELKDITRPPQSSRVIDISISPRVRASDLRVMLNLLQSAGEIDGGLPIIRDRILVGLLPAPDLEFALDGLEGPEDETFCLMAIVDSDPSNHQRYWPGELAEDVIHEDTLVSADGQRSYECADFTPFIDPAPVSLDVHSPMDLVCQCFVKLGLRYIVVVEGGEYRGLVHKKGFVRYVKENSAH